MPYTDAEPGTSADADHPGDGNTTAWPPYRDSVSDDTQPRTGVLIDVSPSTAAVATTSPDPPAERRRDTKPVTASWRDLPRRDQLIVITLARLSEPLVQTSIQSYMFYQLKWFDPTLPDSVISSQAGILQ